MRSRKMRFIELTVLKNDMDIVLKYLGKKGAIQFSQNGSRRANVNGDNGEIARIRSIIERLADACEFLGIELPVDEDFEDEHFFVPGEEDEKNAQNLCSVIENIKSNKDKTEQERKRVLDAINETMAFSKMNMPFSDMEKLSYLTLRIGRLDQKDHAQLREDIGERAVIIPLDDGEKILAASSKKGRFALDSALKKFSFEPLPMPSGNRDMPCEILKGLKAQLLRLEEELESINNEKENVFQNKKDTLLHLASLWKINLAMEDLKSRFTATESLYHFSGWTPAETASEITGGLLELTGGRIAIKTYSPKEIPSVKNGTEKVPVSMKHGFFVKGFEGVVFSYGAPLYGTIDPTPLVAFFFTVLFGIMFGDVGQGFILLLAGFLIKKTQWLKSKFIKYSTPLIAIGISSIVMGCLAGSVFTNEHLLVAPTRAITGALTGHPMDRILYIMPMAELGGSITKLLYFFGFTMSIGVMLISIGLCINIINRCILKKYEEAFFSKTGLAGILMFWYALFIAVRILLDGSFEWFDILGLSVPVFCIFFGPVIWRIASGKRPVLENGLLTFIMEGFVEILETVSTYLSNTVSFLRVGAFALSHTVLSFIVFRFSEELAASGAAGTITAIFIMIIGNAIIIVLEGMIVAIQVVRLQYYEFFNKFFVETGVEFAPFQFKTKKI